jgi:transcriptional regulator with XRE-family HTH domain
MRRSGLSDRQTARLGAMAPVHPLFEALPSVLRTLRHQKGWTLGQVGDAAQVDVGNLSRYETGETCPTLAVLGRLLEAYGTDVHGLADLLKAEGSPAALAPRPADPFVAAVRDAMDRLGYPPRTASERKPRQRKKNVKPRPLT